MDRDFTEADFLELNDLKRSVAGCQRSLEQARQEQPVTGIPRPPVRLSSNDPPASEDPPLVERRKSRSRPRSVRGRSKRDRRHPDAGDRRPSRRRKGEPTGTVVVPEVTIPRPTMAAIFQAGAEDLSSSCPTSQEPAPSVPYLFQMAGATLPMGGSPQPIPPSDNTTDQSGPPRDPRSQSERRRRVSIQTPPALDNPSEAQIPVPFGGRPFLPRSASAEPQRPQGDYSALARQDPHQQGRSTYYGR